MFVTGATFAFFLLSFETQTQTHVTSVLRYRFFKEIVVSGGLVAWGCSFRVLGL
jgi:hypothetical protein